MKLPLGTVKKLDQIINEQGPLIEVKPIVPRLSDVLIITSDDNSDIVMRYSVREPISPGTKSIDALLASQQASQASKPFPPEADFLEDGPIFRVPTP